jgi:hypothetical protein
MWNREFKIKNREVFQENREQGPEEGCFLKGQAQAIFL